MTDRATLYNLIVGLNGYTVCSGLLSRELNGSNMVSIPLDVSQDMRIGVIERSNMATNRLSEYYKQALLDACPSVL